jgi:hypothetical protein
VKRIPGLEIAQGPLWEALERKIEMGTGGTPVRPYLNAASPVTSMPVISKWMSCVPS